MGLLSSLRVVTIALNLPGPAACARLRDLGAAIDKVEPPSGDPFATYCAEWYRSLHDGMGVHRIDLKTAAGRGRFDALLAKADLFVTAQRPSALRRLGLGPEDLRARFPRLCQVAITGHEPPHTEVPGHDLTYMASLGLVTPPRMPPTLFADMAGAERTVSTALALLWGRDHGEAARYAESPLETAADALAQPLRHGLTAPGALLGGGCAGYNLYAASDGWIAVAALETHFAQRLAEAFHLGALTTEALAERFATQSTNHWESWARERDLPIVAVQSFSQAHE